MFTRMGTGLALARASWGVLLGDKKLLAFPVLSLLLTLLVVAAFGVPLGYLFTEGHLRNENGKLSSWVYPIAFTAYFCISFVVIFCNAALLSCVMKRLNGQPTTVGDGLRMAMHRRRQILAWAIVSACVGVLLMVIESHKQGGKLVARLLGSAWSIMTYFALPVLVVQDVGPVQAIKGSMSLLRKTWGETLTGKVGLGLFSLLLFVPVGVLFAAGILTLPRDASLAYILFGLAACALGVYAIVTSTMSTIFLTAVYQYAAFDRVPDGFDSDTLAHAFFHKPTN